MIPPAHSALRALCFFLALAGSVSARAAAAWPSAAVGGPSASEVSGPVKIWIVLKDKGPAAEAAGGETPGAATPGGGANAGSSLAVRAFENLPVYAPYIEILSAGGFKPDVRLKWQNRVSGYADAQAIDRIRAL